MAARLLQVDAFTGAAFTGNPAAVCLLETPADPTWMQRVAAEMNLSETAFLVPRAADAGAPVGDWDLRWFTPEVEVPLCGHATLASAHALWETGVSSAPELRFHTRSGALLARRREGRIELDLPAHPLEPVAPPPGALDALGIAPLFVGRTPERALEDRDYLFELETPGEVRALRPDFPRLRAVATAGWIVTAHNEGSGHDFVSRYFAPAFGIDEDPVTGLAHCALVPFWAARLGRDAVVGYQCSERGGTVYGRAAGDRVLLAGEAVTVLRGELLV